MSALLTSALTVLLGFVVFVGGQIVQRFLLEPLQEQRRVIGEIAHALVYYDNAYLDDKLIENASEEWLYLHKEYLSEASKAIRDLAGRLWGTLWSIPYYTAFAHFGWVPKWNDGVAAVNELRGWANGMEGGDAGTRTKHRREVIAQKLGIEGEVQIIEQASATEVASVERAVRRQDDEDRDTFDALGEEDVNSELETPANSAETPRKM